MTKLNLTSMRLSLEDCLTVSGGWPEKDHYCSKVGSAWTAELVGREAAVSPWIGCYICQCALRTRHQFFTLIEQKLTHWLSLGCKNEGNNQKLALKVVF